MKKLLFLLAFYCSFSVWSQNIGNPGGGKPAEVDIKEKCEILFLIITEEEKNILNDFKKKYHSEEDFFKLLEELKVSKSLSLIDNPQVLSSCNCEAKIQTHLKSILNYYRDAENWSCKELESRLSKINLIQDVMKLYSHEK